MGNLLCPSPEPAGQMAEIPSLERLPIDLVWKIIEYVPESVYDLRLTSRTLQSLVDKYALLGTTIPLVKDLAYFGAYQSSSSGEPAGKLEIVIVPLADGAQLFELRNKLRSFELIKKRKGSKDYVLKLWPHDEENLTLLKACIGKKIDYVSLVNCSVSELPAASKLLEGITFEKLRFAKDILSEELAKFMLNSITTHKVEQLILDLGTTTRDAVSILIDLSTRLRTLHIYQQSRRGIVTKGDKYLLGVYNARWAPIILELFGGKLDKLCIENPYYPEYFINAQFQFLIANIPKLKKNVWFETSCDRSIAHLSTVINEHAVEVNTLGNTRVLSVKHISRKDERRIY